MSRRVWSCIARLLTVLLGMLLSLACDEGIGRELVGELTSGRTSDTCAEVECMPIGEFVPMREPMPSPIVASRCFSPIEVSDSNAPTPLNLQCARWNLTVVPEAPRELVALNAQDLALHLFAERPARVTLSGASLIDSQIVLHGPITVRVASGSLLSNVQLLDDGSGGASFELVESSARGLLVGDGIRDFAGALFVTRSSLTGGKVLARSLAFVNVQLRDIKAVTDSLVMQTVRGKGLRFEAERAILGNVTLENLDVQRCGSLHITNSVLQTIMVAACREPLRVDRSEILAGSVLGRVESKVTLWRGISFGAGQGTELELWGGSFLNNILCEGTQRVALAGTAKCNRCPALGPAAAAIVCRGQSPDADAGVELANLECPALDQAPPCDPAPTDEYPF